MSCLPICQPNCPFGSWEISPEKYRTVLILRDVQHLGINETAKAVSLSEANVQGWLRMRDASTTASMGLAVEGGPTKEFALSDA